MPTYREDMHTGHKVPLVETDDIMKGAVTTDKLDNNAVTTDKLADDAVTNDKIANQAVDNRTLAPDSITNEKVVDNTLTGDKFQDDSIGGEKIKDNTVPGSKLANGSITGIDIQDGTLPGTKLVDGTVSGAKLSDNAIESRHLLDNSIPGEKIKDNTIENVDIKDGTLGGEKIKDNTIEGTKIADGAIGTDKIVDNSVNTGKIADGAVTESKIADNSVANAKIGAGAVTTEKIENEAITEEKLAPGAVTTEKLSDGMIEQLQTITDAVPTVGSVKPMQSGGVLVHGSAFDISEYNKNGDTLATYETLADALAAIPSSVKRGGMSIKFIQSSDNKYIQARCMAQNFTTDVTQWQGVDDEPVAASPNLVDSGGVKSYIDLNSKFGKLLYNDGNAYSNKIGAIAGHRINITLSDISVLDTSASVYLGIYVKYNDNESESKITASNNPDFVLSDNYTFTLSKDYGDVEYLRISVRILEGTMLYYQVDDLTHLVENRDYLTRALNNQDKSFGEFCSKPLFTYGRIETNAELSDGYKVEEPVSIGYAHSQILHNVLQVTPTTIPCAVLKYDNEGRYLGHLPASTDARVLSCENIRLQVPVSNGVTLTDIESSITIVSNYEKHKLDSIDTIGSEKVVYYQGGFNNQGILTNTPNRVHTNILKNVKSITPLTGYEFTLIQYNADGSIDNTLWGWKQTELILPISDKTIMIAVRNIGESAFDAEDATEILTIVRYSSAELLFSKSYGCTKRNVSLDYGNISPTTSEVANSNTNRLHSGYIDNFLGVYVESGYQVAILIINEDGTYDNTYYVWSSEYLLNKPTRVRFNIRKSDKTDISDITDVIPHVYVLTGTPYIPKRISILGDSLSTFGTATTEHTDPQDNYGGIWTYPENKCRYPQDNLFTDVDHIWFKRLIDNFGFTLGINESYAGTTITDARTDIPPLSLQSRINHLDDNGTPDIIFIFGGTNDINRGAAAGVPEVPIGTFNTEDPTNYTDEEIAELPNHTFADGVRTMLIRVLKTYPTSKVIMILPFITTNPERNTRLDEFLEVLKEACDYFGVPYVDARRAGINMWNRTSYLPDFLHCNAKGAEMLYEEISSFVRGNELLLKYL